MADSKRSSGRRGRRRKRRNSVTKNVVSFVRTYQKEILGILFLCFIVLCALYVYKHWQGP